MVENPRNLSDIIDVDDPYMKKFVRQRVIYFLRSNYGTNYGRISGGYNTSPSNYS